MIVCIVRHGKADRESVSGVDADRQLRPRGQRQAAYLSTHLGQKLTGRRMVVSSPYTRAHQTAELIAAAMDVPLEFDDRLSSGEPVSRALELISQRGGRDVSLCVVGHNPQLEQLAGVLVGGPAAVSEDLRTGEAVLMELEDWTEPIGKARELGRIRMDESGRGEEHGSRPGPRA